MTTRKVTIEVNQAGNAKASLGDTSRAMQDLGKTAKESQAAYKVSMREMEESEKRYQDLLRQRSRIHQDAGKAQQGAGGPLAGLGGGGPLSGGTGGAGGGALSRVTGGQGGGGLGQLLSGVGNKTGFGQQLQGMAGKLGDLGGLAKGAGFGQLGGALGQLGGAAGAAAGPIAAVAKGIELAGQAMSMVGKYANIVNDPHKSDSAKARQIGESIPVIGTFVKGMHEMAYALDGTTAALKRLDAQSEVNAAAIAEEGRRRSQVNSAMADFRGAKYEATHLGALAAPRQGLTARGTMEEKIAYEADQATLQSRDSAQVARAKANAARATHSAAREDLEQKRARHKGLLSQRDEAAGRFKDVTAENDRGAMRGGIENIRDLHESKQKEIELNKRVANSQAEIDAAVQKTGQTGRAAAEAESGARKANIAVMERELGVIRAKEGRLAGQSQSFGALNVAERAQFGVAAKRAKDLADKGQLHMLGRSQRAILERGGAGRFLHAEFERGAEKDARYKMVQNLDVLEKGKVQDVRGQGDEKQLDLRGAVREDTQKLGKDVADALRDVVRELGREMVSAIAQVKKDVQALQQKRWTSGG